MMQILTSVTMTTGNANITVKTRREITRVIVQLATSSMMTAELATVSYM